MDLGWTWATQSRYAGFCLSIVRDRDPATVADQLGGGTLETMTADAADQRYPLDQRGSLLRLGTTAGWTYCYEDRAPVGLQPSRIQQLSSGTELLQVVKGGDGTNLVCRAVDGQLTERFEPGAKTPPRGQGPALLHRRVEQLLTDQPDLSALVASFQILSEHTGVVVDRQLLDGPLPTTFSTFIEPRPTLRSPIQTRRLGRNLGTLSPAQDSTPPA